MTDLLERLQDRADNTNYIATTFDKVKFSGSDGKLLVIDGSEKKLTEAGFRTLCEGMKIPYAYAKRCPTSLLERNVNFWLEQRGDSRFTALSTRDDQIRSFMNPGYEYVPSVDIFRAVLDKVNGSWEVRNSTVSDAEVKIAITTERESGHVVNDITAAGISLVHSDSWAYAPRFDSYLLRLACTNGQVAPVQGRKFRVSGHSVEEIVNQVGEFAEEAFSQLDNMLAGYERLREQNVENAAQLLAKICRENKLPTKVFEALLAALHSDSFINTMPNSRVTTMFDLMQVLTWVGTHNQELTEAHRNHLQMIAGSMSLTGQTRCVSCGSSVD